MGLDEIRQNIDRVDGQLRELFLQRMDLSRQVAETKKMTGSAVYMPEREQEILAVRTEGIKKEYVLECRAFFQSIMEISRTYQYFRLTDRFEQAEKLPNGEGKISICFSGEEKSRQPAVFLNAAILAGLCVEESELKKEEGKLLCRFCLSGDFSLEISKAAVLLMLEENESTDISLL